MSCVVGLPSLASAAAQKAAGPPHNPTVTEAIMLRGTNGYVVHVELRNRSALAVSTEKYEKPGLLLTSYTLQAPQPRGSNAIKASLGRFGRIDVRFVPESTEEVEPLLPVCKSELETIELGRYVGVIAFRGERGYTQVRSEHAAGGVSIKPAPSCHRHRSPNAPHKRGSTDELLGAARKAAGESAGESHLAELKVTTAGPEVTFDAATIEIPGGKHQMLHLGNFFASAHRDRGRIEEESDAFDLLVSGPYFVVPDWTRPSAEAVVTPPSPFLGTATFSHDSSGAISWRGDLRLNLPGFGVVPLAGRASKATMCADAGCRHHH